jgi:hypothetical protein
MSQFVSVVLVHGEVPESLSSGPGIGKSFANHFDDLNAMARGLGLRPLDDFYVDYMEQLEAIWTDENFQVEGLEEATSRIGADGPWFDPDEGLRSVYGLIQHIESLPANEVNTLEGPLTVLRSIASELEYAKQQDSRFHLAFQE